MADGTHEILQGYLQRFAPRTETEASVVSRVLALTSGGSPWDRTASLHVTASALILHPPTGRVLLRWHERQHAWLQIGGHGDPGEDDPLAVALREGAEETGLTDLQPWPSADLRHVVIVPVPASRREPAHQHADLRFFLRTDRPETARPEHVGAEVRWLTTDDAASLTTEPNVRETIARAAAFLETA